MQRRNSKGSETKPNEMKRRENAVFGTSDTDLGEGHLNRRDAMKVLLGASAAVSLGLGGCERKPKRQIISRVAGPEYQQPGRTLQYASTWTEGGFPYGLVIKTVDGRPVKIEGNPDHPVNRGASSTAMQAATLSLYDPDRLREPQANGTAISWQRADERIIGALKKASTVALVTRATLGPSERALIKRFQEQVPGTRHFVHETADDRTRRSAWKAVYDRDGEVVPKLESAKVVLGFDADFLGQEGTFLESIRGYAQSRTLDDRHHRSAQLPRFYAVDATMTSTSGNADQRIRIRPSLMGPLSQALYAAVTGNPDGLKPFAEKHDLDRAQLEALATDLTTHRGQAAVLAGVHLPASVHASVALLNDALGAADHTLMWNSNTSLPCSDPSELAGFFGNGVDVAIFLGVNPVYDFPGGKFKPLLAKTKLSVTHGLALNETAEASSIALPSAHNLESWNDAEPRKGMHTLCQPVIAPLFSGRQEAESLLRWTQALVPPGHDLNQLEDWHEFIRHRWLRAQPETMPEETPVTADAGPTAPALAATSLAPQAKDGLPLATRRGWEKVLAAGGRFETVAEPFPPFNRAVALQLAAKKQEQGAYEVVIHPHHAVHDGRFANNAWLQELPDPVSKHVWDNVAAMSPATAAGLTVVEGDIVSVEVAEQSVELPALVEPGFADGVVALTLGHGRTAGGEVLKLAGGANVAPLIGAENVATPRLATNARVTKAGGKAAIARVQKYFKLRVPEFEKEDRPIVLEGTLDEYRHDAAFVKHKRHLPKPVELYEEVDYSGGHKWGLSVDMNRCVGCNACMIACQAENNVPVVGKEQCDKGRVMHWLRIDRYVTGDQENPTVHQQPMMCQQCDHAPCETVCPVNATTHSPEGLNDQTYNRCVGTRFCASNCPFKVRRFNYLRFHEQQMRDPVQELVHNPQVTVRSVGVMEKCTFCVQRINAAKFAAKNADQPLEDGSVQTACQQACPAQAIHFGDVNDSKSKIVIQRGKARAYRVLEELNVRPNVSYLARVRNPGTRPPGDKKKERSDR